MFITWHVFHQRIAQVRKFTFLMCKRCTVNQLRTRSGTWQQIQNQQWHCADVKDRDRLSGWLPFISGRLLNSAYPDQEPQQPSCKLACVQDDMNIHKCQMARCHWTYQTRVTCKILHSVISHNGTADKCCHLFGAFCCSSALDLCSRRFDGHIRVANLEKGKNRVIRVKKSGEIVSISWRCFKTCVR